MNGLQGPWSPQQIVYFVDPRTMETFHWPDGTTGGGIAIREAVESIKSMRRFRPGAAPVVELSSKFMPTKFGGRQRPHFEIKSWVSLTREQPAALPAPNPVPAAPVTLAQSPPLAEAEPLSKPVSIAEEMDDAIPF
jgi:hypothetical protein